MVCFKKKFKSRTKIGKFNTKREEFYVYRLWLEIFKDNKGIHICVNKREPDKIYQRISFLSRKFVSAAVLKTVLFVKDLNLFMKKIYLWKIYSKTNKYGFELKHII